MSLITTTKDLSAVCRRLAIHPFVTVDTEFLRETTFWPRLCVVQIASEEEAVAVDAMAEGLDLAPFFELMADSRLTKIFHAARQDLEIIWNLARLIPAPNRRPRVESKQPFLGERREELDCEERIAASLLMH